jgi:hypothetical protein
MAAPKKIINLVEKFERNIEAYQSNHYNGAQVRQEFINPFFEALDDTYDVLIRRMEHIGAVEKISSVMGPEGYAIAFWPSAYVVELTREIDAQKESPVDIVEQLKNRIRQNPWTAWPIIIILALAFLIPAINQFWELARKVAGLCK